jgi:3-oxoacyl-[acyl-carrier-protein] synthase II
MTRTATASSWARAPASWCSRNYEHAKARGAKIYAEVIGYGLSGDAYHITAPSEDGDGAFRCMSAAIKRAGIARRHRLHQRPRHLDAARRRDRARRGGAAGRQRRAARSRCRRPSRRSAICSAPPARSRRSSRAGDPRRVAPPTLNLDNPSVETAIDLVPHKARKREIDVALSNSFGFGGTNAGHSAFRTIRFPECRARDGRG